MTTTSAYFRFLAFALVIFLGFSSLTVPMQSNAAGATVVTFLTSGTSWTVPSDWNSNNNKIEVIAGGGGGGRGDAGVASGPGSGAGGGYSKVTNVTLTAGGSVTYAVGSGGAGATTDAGTGGTGGDTYFCNSTSNCASVTGTAVIVSAKGGTGGKGSVTVAGGVGGCGGPTTVASTTYCGGDGKSNSGMYGGNGGGGAAGPNGDGGDGGTATSPISGDHSVGGAGGGGGGGGSTGGANNANSGGTGGNNYAGAGGGAGGDDGAGTAGTAGGGGGGGGDGTTPGIGGAGGAGTDWDSTHGSGGGGGGGGACMSTGTPTCGTELAGAGGAGGLYGGGGGVGSYTGSAGQEVNGGNGAQGIIVITYASRTTVAINANANITSNLDVRGSVSKGSGTFVIDHPLNPRSMLLYHSFVESPDAKNIYDGIVKLDENGEATIEFPEYFQALNESFRYQFFPIGRPMPNLHIKNEIQNNSFTITGGAPRGTISWQVSGIRHDPYIQANPIRVEVPKGPNEIVNKGEYLHPEFYTQ